jgi:hypothetical protein
VLKTYYYGKDGSDARQKEAEGFDHWPFDLVLMGWSEWKRTGKLPNPRELMKLPTTWVNEIYKWDALVEGNKPDDR